MDSLTRQANPVLKRSTFPLDAINRLDGEKGSRFVTLNSDDESNREYYVMAGGDSIEAACGSDTPARFSFNVRDVFDGEDFRGGQFRTAMGGTYGVASGGPRNYRSENTVGHSRKEYEVKVVTASNPTMTLEL